MDLREQKNNINQNSHWYYFTKSIPLIRFTRRLIQKAKSPITIIDVGSGTGYFSNVLEKKFGPSISKIIQVDINYTDDEVKLSSEKKIEKRKQLPVEISNSLIIMMDVLEHIKEDNKFLQDLVSRTKDKNLFFITVPAFMGLWSYHDEYLLHFRRYTLKTVSELVTRSGIKIHSRYYLYLLLFPIAWLVRRVINKNQKKGSDMSQVSVFVNFILKTYFSFEMFLTKLNRMAGTSCCIEGSIHK